MRLRVQRTLLSESMSIIYAKKEKLGVTISACPLLRITWTAALYESGVDVMRHIRGHAANFL